MRRSWRTSDSQLNQASMNSKIVGPPSTIGRTSASYIGRSKYNNFSLFASHNKGKIGASRDIGRDVTGARGSAHNVLGTSANALLLNEVNRAQGVYDLAVIAHIDASNNRLIKNSERHVDASFSQPYIGEEAIAAINEDRNTLLTFLDSSELQIKINSLSGTTQTSAKGAKNQLISDISGGDISDEDKYYTYIEVNGDITDISGWIEKIKTANTNLQELAFGNKRSIQYTLLIDEYNLDVNVPDISNSYNLATSAINAEAAYNLAITTETIAKAAEESALEVLQKAKSEVYVPK